MEMPISLGVIDTDTGDEISNTPLMQCGGFLTGSVTIPDTIFQYQLRGADVHGFAFEHTSNYLVNSTSADDRTVIQLDCPVASSSISPSTTSLRPTTSPSASPRPHPPGGAAAANFIPASIIPNLIGAVVIVLLTVHVVM